MRGEHQGVVRNNKVQIKLKVRRNLTILQSNSATGKLTLLDLIDAYDNLGVDSGVIVNCDVPCKVISGKDWERDLSFAHNSIVFVDEGNFFLRSHDFAAAAKRSSNYFVIVSREPLPQLPDSVEEIYGLKNTSRTSSKYPQYSRVYTGTYRVYGDALYDGAVPDLVVVEGSNSGFEFFSALCRKNSVSCVSACGKGNIYKVVRDTSASSILVIADGAAFGPHMDLVMSLRRLKSVQLFLPESFEWLILNSDLFNDRETQEILEHPSNFIESGEFFSWEQFFTKTLIENTANTYLAYRKEELNPAYLNPREFAAIDVTGNCLMSD